jgi:endonuclease VIII
MGYRATDVRALRSLWSVPEGDTIHRAAAALRTALTGRPTVRFDAPRLFGPRPGDSRMIEQVESHGKHLEIKWDDGIVLHTHLRMNGSWHLYRAGERWRRPSEQMRVVIEVPEWVAVCFNAPTVETYREFDRFRHPGSGRLGPDLCTATDRELLECARRIHQYADPQTPISEVLLDQHVACGVGNVYRSEVLWACEISPFAEVGSMEPTDCMQLINAAARMLRANLQRSYRVTAEEIPGGLAVYSRNGQRCARCGDTVQVRRVGEHARMLYWCPGCQVRHQPMAAPQFVEPGPVMDPHPAAAKYLADLPWRRDSLAG